MTEKEDARESESSAALCACRRRGVLDGKCATDDELNVRIPISQLADRFESVLQKAKELELDHLIEPIESAAQKLRQLEDLAELAATEFHDALECADETICGEQHEAVPACSAVCACESRCGSGSGDESRCSPCRCTIDPDTGRHARSTEEKKIRPCTADRPAACQRSRLNQRRLDTTKFEIAANLTKKSLAVNRQMTTTTDTTFVKEDRDQAVSCELSDTSLMGDCELECTESGTDVCSAGTARKGLLSNVNACGCGGGRAQQQTCPCGCGDLQQLPRDQCQSWSCRCEKCGKEIAEVWEMKAEKCTGDEELCAFRSVIDVQRNRQIPGDGKLPALFHADIRMYIDKLETKCREKDEAIMKLKQMVEGQR